MESAIIVVWWVALVGALMLTIIAVAEIVRIIHHLQEIHRLASMTLPAAQGIVTNTAGIAALDGVAPIVTRFLTASDSVDHASAAIEGRSATLERIRRHRGGA